LWSNRWDIADKLATPAPAIWYERPEERYRSGVFPKETAVTGISDSLERSLRSRDVARVVSYIRDRELQEPHRGGVLFVSGSEFDDIDGVLEGIEHALEQQPGSRLILRGALRDGVFVRASAGEHRSAADRADDITTLAKSLLPVPANIKEFVFGLIEGSAAAYRLYEDWRSPGSARLSVGPDLTVRLLRAAATERQVLVLADADDASGSVWFWEQLQDAWSPAVATDVRAFFVVAARLAADPDQQVTPVRTRVARHLIERGAAARHDLRPLERDDVTAWLEPADDSLVSRLREAAGGEAALLGGTLQEWDHAGMLQRASDGVLRFTAAADVRGRDSLHALAVQRIRDLVPLSDTTPCDPVLALALGSLQGEVFDADAVASVLDMDRDSLVDFLDERLGPDAGARAVVAEAPHATVVRPDGTRRFCRYRFTSTGLWLGLRTQAIGADARREDARRLAGALEALYGEDQAQLQIASSLAVLRALAGDTEDAARWDRIAEDATTPDTLRWRAHLVIASDHGSWPAERCVSGVELLWRALLALTWQIPSDERRAYADTAATLADRSKSDMALALALYSRCAQLSLDGLFAEAIRPGHESVRAFEAIPDPPRAASAALLLAQAYASAHQVPGAATEAVAWFKRALRDSGPANSARALLGLAAAEPDPGERRRLLLQARTLVPASGTDALQAEILIALARVDVIRGNLTAATDGLRRAGAIVEALDSLPELWQARWYLAGAELASGALEPAARTARTALEVARRRGRTDTICSSLLLVAVTETYACRDEAAHKALAEYAQLSGMPVIAAIGPMADLFEAITADRPRGGGGGGGAGPARASDPASLQRIVALSVVTGMHPGRIIAAMRGRDH
jgi:tetratricopeptide (TPR) repeat protein